MKRLLLTCLLAAPLSCFASGGPIDGAYECNVSGQSTAIAVVGYPNGQSAFGVVALNPGQALNGYGFGQVLGANFFGTTNFGGQFNFLISGLVLTGTIQIATVGGFFNASATCVKVF